MTIAEVSRKYDLSADTLRYYERIGLIPTVTRNKSGIRDYSEADLGWVEFSKCMRSAGVQVEALIEYVSSSHNYRWFLPIITVLLGTGIRCGELTGLTWNDIEFQ